ncbi:triphosphoribosyl-dephospho-CoA synthase [Caballeronia humi]|uniref:ATP:dephospho-CoA triphosphoribosyl transferase n=1 Tax=Caballeronia humi TaxID=326474 RepID=A0A158F8N1_9BURK|nr:triphosphoribosyl-dephospho-CoA synthase [Caballeronia humi]SAL16091.1 ATP:dephospho-CoA triphosphoribosyl transferase [Caballeronia humi]
MQAADARDAFLRACRLDVETPKPGNVSVDSAGHGMTAAQFIASAEAAAGALFTRGAGVGERILAAVERTREVAGCNTNLGIVLLCAPLATALEAHPVDAAAWRAETERVLERLDIDDARAAYRAIALANPGGLGDAPEQSVRDEPSVDLRAAMTLAAGRDSIARQYANGFRDIFETGLAAAMSFKSPTAATLNVFLTFLATWPDSHIVRKQGVTMAQSVTREARLRHGEWQAAAASGATPRLAAWDADLKARGINPGTSADLTVATLFVAGCVVQNPRDWHGS